MTTSVNWPALGLAGLAAGLVQVAAGVVMYLAGVYFAPWSGLVSLLVLAACIAAGIVWSRKHGFDGRTTYWGAFMVGAAVTLGTALVYVTYNAISVTFVYPHFLEDMVQARLAAEQAAGLDPARANEVLSRLRADTTLGRIMTGNFVFLGVRGLVLSALLSGVGRFFDKTSRTMTKV